VLSVAQHFAVFFHRFRSLCHPLVGRSPRWPPSAAW
jgi:hypothetical protein